MKAGPLFHPFLCAMKSARRGALPRFGGTVKLLLWDIDGTLIYSGGVAGEAMRTAMERVYGRASLTDRQTYAGKTDQQIILETFPERSPEELLGRLDEFMAEYLHELSTHHDALRQRGRVLDGVVAALEQLSDKPVILSLLTGNLQPVARLKLELLGLAQFFNFDAGAYGSDHHMRIRLVPIAAQRAAALYNREFAGQDVVVIGDTPNDIACGKAANARTVAVATGPFSVAELQAHQPDVTLKDLSDTAAVLAALG
jgi:phosphoglycolate phosphatase